MSIIGASQNVSDSSARSRPGTREFAAQRFSRGDWSKLAGTAVLADAALAKSDQPALLATEIPRSASLHAALISESAVQPTSTNQVSVSVPGQPTAQPSADSQRTAERWMHVDDLGKQFGSVIQGALLNRTVAGQTSLRIMLYPENMGGIEAEIIDNNQSVTVNLIAQSDEVVRLLKDQSQALRDLLAQSGSFELNILKERSGSDAHQARDQSGSANDRSQPHLESLPKPGNGVAPGSLGPKESGELDTYV
jgi:flagellar hook-length control protein FliK